MNIMKTYFILFLILNFCKLYAQDVQSVLSNISVEDKKDLSTFFSFIMKGNHLAYTLFGEKPISLAAYFTKTPYNNVLIIKSSDGSLAIEYLKIWKKHENKFNIKNFLFIEEKSIDCPDVNNIVLINKKEFVKIVDRNIDIFKKILKWDVTGLKLLNKIEENKKFIEHIQNSQLLWGILLGYGVHNAKLFDRRCQLEYFVEDDDLVLQKTILMKPPEPTEGFSSIEEEYDFLKAHLTLFGSHNYSPLMIGTVHFMADHEHAETKILAKKYAEMRSKIALIYAENEFLEVTLSKLTSD